MSINNGRQQRKSSTAKKQTSNAAPTNTVYPILRPSQKSSQANDVANGVSNGSRISRGQCVNPRPAVQPRIVASVAEFVSEVIPQSSNPNHAQHEQIQWVRIQKVPLGEHQRKCTFIVVVGLARGYQIWMMLENGSCEEVVSERRGPLKVAHLLPHCAKESDKFHDERPLLAIVDGNPMCAENKYCTVDILSLKTGKIVHCLKYNEPVMDLASSNNSFIVALSETILVYDNETLNEMCSFIVPPSSDPTIPPVFSVSDCFLAFGDSNLNTSIQSCGGRIDEDDNSYSGQVLSAAKSISKTVTSIGETLVSSFSNPSNDKRNILIDPGVVSVINLNDLPRCNDARPINNHFIAHFIAHKTGVSHIAFGNGGRLLFTSNEASTTFNIFVLQPHPVSCRLSSVQHIYTLHRGNSAAKVVETAFSVDNRWLAVSTNHGTTHVFAICPLGGAACMRTHGGKFIKESNFERSAGLNAENQISYNVHSKQPTSSTFVDHPALAKQPIITRTMVNPRLTRFPPPIVQWSYAKIKQHVFSAENLSAWASDNTPVSLANSGRSQSNIVAGQPFFESHRRLALCFGTVYGDRCAPAENPVLFIVNADGMLYQYKIEIRRERLNSSGSLSSLNNNDVGGLSPSSALQYNSNGVETSGRALEAPIQIRTIALSQWSLTRNRAIGLNVICPPLHETSPILKIGQSSKSQKNGNACQKTKNNGWLQHVEIKTYSEPHRRLWLGPQFTFGVYNINKHTSAELMSPATNKPVHFTTAQKCCPVLIEKNSNIGILRCDTSMDSASRIVCGSWTSDTSGRYANDPLATLKEKLEDAMRDQNQSNRHSSDSFSTPSSSSSSK